MTRLRGWVIGVLGGLLSVFLIAVLMGFIGTELRRTRTLGSQRGLRIVCTTYPVWLMTKAVVEGVREVRVERLLPAQAGCPHEYTVTVQDMQQLSRADVLVCNGLGLDEAIVEVFKKQRPNRPVVDASKGIPGLIRSALPEYAEHALAEQTTYNPHLFASPFQAAKMLGRIADGLGRVDARHSAAYHRNAERWAREYRQAGEELRAVAESLENRAIITQHGAFDYFARDIGLEIAGVITAHPGEDPSASEVLQLVRTVRQRHVGAVFTEPQYSSAIGTTVAREAGIPHGVLDPVATGPDEASPEYYVRAMRQNGETLQKVLGSKK